MLVATTTAIYHLEYCSSRGPLEIGWISQQIHSDKLGLGGRPGDRDRGSRRVGRLWSSGPATASEKVNGLSPFLPLSDHLIYVEMGM